jgi:hypothetical protein
MCIHVLLTSISSFAHEYKLRLRRYMAVILTAMNRFINETHGSRTAFLDGNQPARLCAPMVEHVAARGGEVRTGAALRQILVDEVKPA